MAKKIVVTSGKGGVGKSSTVWGLCHSFVLQGKKVLVIDFDIGLRSLDLFFGVSKKIVFDWGDIILDRCELEKAYVDINGATLLAAPQKFSKDFTTDAVKELIGRLDNYFDIILLDAPAGISDGFYLAACTATTALVVSTPDNICVRCGSITAEKLASLGIDDIRLIINRFSKKAAQNRKLLNIDDVIDSAGIQLIGVVPEDSYVTYCTSLGIKPPQDSSAAEAFLNISKRVLGEKVYLDLSILS
ncbi:MAG TPA: P-loop NTPase [Clostridia bacterium]|nr:P-loop NTPase [Clostridia bacterium]